MRLDKLQRKHADYDRETMDLYAALFEGGVKFRKNVKKYLERHDVEPLALYERRAKAAHYLNYAGRIGNFFASWLFTSPLTLDSGRSDDPTVPPDDDPFYGAFKEDCDGAGTDLSRFLRGRLVEAMQKQRAYWIVEQAEQPDEAELAQMTVRDWKDVGGDRVRLRAIPTEQVTNWKRDREGNLLWVVQHECVTELDDFASPDDETTTETWTLWKADGTARRWQDVRKKSEKRKPDFDVPEVDAPRSTLGVLPVVELCLPTELWLMDNLADPQLEHFRARNALSWSMQRACYAMALFKLKNRNKKPVMGSGYHLILGVDEDMSWPAPPATPFSVGKEYVADLKDEIHRISDQMAQGVNNNAAAVGRSADSKKQDGAATEVVLKAYGALVCEATELTLGLVSLARGDDDYEWSISGLDTFHVTDAETVINNALAADTLAIPSPVFKREVFKKVARKMLTGTDEKKLQVIDQEIDEHVTDESVLNPPEPDDGSGAGGGADNGDAAAGDTGGAADAEA